MKLYTNNNNNRLSFLHRVRALVSCSQFYVEIFSFLSALFLERMILRYLLPWFSKQARQSAARDVCARVAAINVCCTRYKKNFMSLCLSLSPVSCRARAECCGSRGGEFSRTTSTCFIMMRRSNFGESNFRGVIMINSQASSMRRALIRGKWGAPVYGIWWLFRARCR